MQEDYQLWVWLDFVSLLGSTYELYTCLPRAFSKGIPPCVAYHGSVSNLIEWALNEVPLPLLLFFQKSFTPCPFSVLWRVHVGLLSFKLEIIMASSSSGITLIVRDISTPSARHVIFNVCLFFVFSSLQHSAILCLA